MRFREMITEGFLTGVSIASGIVIVGSIFGFLYWLWTAQHPTKPDAIYFSKGPQDRIDTH